MIPIKQLVNNKEECIVRLKKRNIDATEIIETIISLIEEKNKIMSRLETIRHELKENAKQFKNLNNKSNDI